MVFLPTLAYNIYTKLRILVNVTDSFLTWQRAVVMVYLKSTPTSCFGNIIVASFFFIIFA